MFKKIVAVVLVIALTAAASIAGTMAYLTSEDSDVNVMTLGNVYIEQIEQERNAAGELVDFTQAKPAYPAVGPIEWATEGVKVNGTEYKVFTPDLKNVIDKIVTVNNTGKSDAYVRTIVAIEAPDYDPKDLIHISWNEIGVKMSDPVTAEINGDEYVIFVFTYTEALAAGTVSAPSLMQVFLDSKATNEDCAKFGEAWEILVLSQAVQTNGFENAQIALDTAFDPANADNIKNWFSGDKFKAPTVVATAEELADALTAGENVILTNDITLDAAVNVDKTVSINLNGHKLSTNGMNFKAGGSLENGTVTSDGNTSMVPHLKVSGGSFTMDDVTVEIDDYLNYQGQGNNAYGEYTGLEVANATAVLNDCTIYVKNETRRTWNYVYGLTVNDSTVTMNGGSIKVESAGASKTDLKTAVSCIGTSEVTLNNVDVQAETLGTTMGVLTLNTTDATVTDADFVSYGGTHTLNIIK